MNKYLPIILVVLLLIIGGGGFLAFKNRQARPTTPDITTQRGQSQEGNVFTSIKDALTKSLSLECTYKDERGTETKTYIKAGAVRLDAQSTAAGTGANSQVIFKDRKMYSWDPTTKKGVVMEIPEENLNVTPSEQKAPVDNQGESFFKEIEKYKDACKTAVVSDSLFVPPVDVEFQDLSKMLQNLPTGSSGNEAPPSFDLEQLKQQYSPEE